MVLGAIDRVSPVPLYAQIKVVLKEDVVQKRKPGDQFYSDDELALHFRVNRLTVRQAVKELVDEGLLYRVRGVGTFVAGRKVEGQPVYQHGFVSHWMHQGKSVSVRVLKLECVDCTRKVADELGIPIDTKMLYLERLRSSDGAPVVLDYIFMPQDLARHVSSEDFEVEPLHRLLRRAGRQVVTSRIDIEAVIGRGPETELLCIEPGEPLLLRRITLVAPDSTPVTYGESFHRAALFKYRVDVPLEG